MLGNGIVKVKPKYHYIGAFENGKALVQNTVESELYYINENLERIQ